MEVAPSQGQVNSAVRTLVATAGGALAGWAVGKGYISQAQANAILSNQEFISAVTTVLLTVLGATGAAAAGIWGLVVHKQVNEVASVAAMPDVAKVEMLPTQAGMDIANSIPPAPNALVTVSSQRDLKP